MMFFCLILARNELYKSYVIKKIWRKISLIKSLPKKPSPIKSSPKKSSKYCREAVFVGAQEQRHRGRLPVHFQGLCQVGSAAELDWQAQGRKWKVSVRAESASGNCSNIWGWSFAVDLFGYLLGIGFGIGCLPNPNTNTQKLPYPNPNPNTWKLPYSQYDVLLFIISEERAL